MWLMTIALGILLFLCLFFYSRHRLNYWRKRGIPTAPDALPFIGHFHKFFSKDKMIWEYVDEVYKNHGTKGLVGFYSFLQPSLNVMNPELAKAIFIKDFDHFVDRRSFKFNYSDDEIFNHFLTNATGSHWKGVRSVLSPSFTSGKMKGMFPLVEKKADDLVDYIKRHTSADSSIVLRKTFGLYTMEVIASCAFGMEAEVYNNENSAFSTNAEELLKFTFTSMLKIIMFSISPKLSQFLKISFMTPAMQYFVDVIKESVRQRENGLYRGDFLDLMLEAKQDQQNPNSKMPKYPISDNTIVANSVLFILAGFDTTANALSFYFYAMAKNPEIQEQLREEIQGIASEKGEFSYQDIMEAKYLDACLSESLRMYSPATFTERKCTKEFKIPGTDVVIPPEMIVTVPVWSYHYDERYWPDPYEFKPERFMSENKDNIKSGTYLPFGVGPRNCIGQRFALMEAKLVIAKVMLNFEVSLAPEHETISYNRRPGTMRPSDDFRLAFIPLPSPV